MLQAAAVTEPKLSPAVTPGGLERAIQEPKKAPDEQRRGNAPRGHQSSESTKSARGLSSKSLKIEILPSREAPASAARAAPVSRVLSKNL